MPQEGLLQAGEKGKSAKKGGGGTLVVGDMAKILHG